MFGRAAAALVQAALSRALTRIRQGIPEEATLSMGELTARACGKKADYPYGRSLLHDGEGAAPLCPPSHPACPAPRCLALSCPPPPASLLCPVLPRAPPPLPPPTETPTETHTRTRLSRTLLRSSSPLLTNWLRGRS